MPLPKPKPAQPAASPRPPAQRATLAVPDAHPAPAAARVGALRRTEPGDVQTSALAPAPQPPSEEE